MRNSTMNGSRQSRWARLGWLVRHWGDVEFVMEHTNHVKYRATVIASWPNGDNWDEASKEPWPKGGTFMGSGESSGGENTDRIWIDSKGGKVHFHGESMEVAFDLAHRTIKRHVRTQEKQR